MFQSLTKNITQAFRSFTGRGTLSPEMLQKGCEQIKHALLDADVALEVVDSLLGQFTSEALNKKVPTELKHSDYLIKLFHDALIRALTSEHPTTLSLRASPSIILLAGLQGAGKTTCAARLAHKLRQEGKKVLLCSCDTQRLAAIEQLRVLSTQVQCDFFSCDNTLTPQAIASQALTHSKQHSYDVLIVDTAGRTHIDQALMQECTNISEILKPQELLFVLDSMTGQNALAVAKTFDRQLPLTGLVLTKTDSDTRGGAALSAHFICKKPIKFITNGEKIDNLDTFDPKRVAGRILGMGDIVSLIQDIERTSDPNKNAALHKKIIDQGQFDFNDFKHQFEQLQSMGGMKNMLSKLPMFGGLTEKMQNMADEKQFTPFIHLIDSMTPAERARPFLILNVKSRQQRIIKGAGKSHTELKSLLSHFQKAQKMMAKMSKLQGNKMQDMMAKMQDMFGGSNT